MNRINLKNSCSSWYWFKYFEIKYFPSYWVITKYLKNLHSFLSSFTQRRWLVESEDFMSYDNLRSSFKGSYRRLKDFISPLSFGLPPYPRGTINSSCWAIAKYLKNLCSFLSSFTQRRWLAEPEDFISYDNLCSSSKGSYRRLRG